MSVDVVLREVGLRDGLQLVPRVLPTAEKLAWLRAEAAAGVRAFEICSLVPPKIGPQFVDAPEMVAAALALDGVTVSALVPNRKGAERGLELGVHQLNYVMSVSDSHNRANVRRSREESVADFAAIAALFRELEPAKRPILSGGLATAFGCSIEGAIDEYDTVHFAVLLAQAGATRIGIADTVGYADPAAVRRVFKAVREAVAPIPVGAHFHNTRGLGLANALAALDAGIKQIDGCLGGLGGCPFAPGASGNVVTEDLVFMFEKMGVRTGIDLVKLLEVRRSLDGILADVPLDGALIKANLPKGFGASVN